MVAKQVKPDPALSDQLMKAAVQAGRSELAEGLFEQSPGDVAKHVTMIKACGKENNLEGAVNVFNLLKTFTAPSKLFSFPHALIIVTCFATSPGDCSKSPSASSDRPACIAAFMSMSLSAGSGFNCSG